MKSNPVWACEVPEAINKKMSEYMFKDKVAVVTGGAGGIGKAIANRFEALGAKVAVIDIAKNHYFVGDIADRAVLENFAAMVIHEFGRVDFLVNNAPPV